MNILSLLFGNKIKKGKSFFDYSSRDKKKIVKKAALESNRLQLELVKKCQKNYNFD